MRPRPMPRAALAAGALTLVLPTLDAPPAAGQSTATIAAAGVAKKRLHVRSGRRVVVTGAARPGVAGAVARLQVRRRGGWRTIDRDRTGRGGRYVLRQRLHKPQSRGARVRVGGVRRRVGRVNVYRTAHASWYGPGLYGNRLACGGRLRPGRLGVAHKTLPCGTKVTFRRGTRTVRVPVIDRGPYVGGREYDLTEATAQRLRFRGHGAVLTTR